MVTRDWKNPPKPRPIRARRTSVVGLILIVAVTLASCTVPQTMVSSLPDEADTFRADSPVSQPFRADHDGLHRLLVRLHPEGDHRSVAPLGPDDELTVSLAYAPDADPRFPEPAFHQWPEHHEWLPELTSDSVYAQEFCSPYPGLNGIELRVATFGADLSAGTGVIDEQASAVAYTLPVVGEPVTELDPGSSVPVRSAVEGWVQVELDDGAQAFVDMQDFDQLPAPDRHNDADVVLTIIDGSTGDELHATSVNADDMYDNSHVAFAFPEIEGAQGRCYRFELKSPESEPGNAVTFRFDPASEYPDGNAILNGEPTDGDLVFRPLYREHSLERFMMSDLEWAAPYEAYEADFTPVSQSAGRYFRLTVDPGQDQLTLPWSRSRPPGGLALESTDDAAPGGGLIFNATYHARYSATDAVDAATSFARQTWRNDPWFSGLYVAVALGLIVLSLVAIPWRRSQSSVRSERDD